MSSNNHDIGGVAACTPVTASVVLLTYNQEKYVSEALRSILAQTYSPLEIVVSDDFSSDDTFKIAKDICESYEGPHRLILNRNDKNLGIISNFLKAVSLSSGTWIVAAAGDDVSADSRVSTLLRHANTKHSIKGISSSYNLIDEHGLIMPDTRSDALRIEVQHLPVEEIMAMLRVPARSFFLLGATACWHRDVFEKFPPITPDPIIAEDIILTWRAKILGEAVILTEKLVSYRSHSGSLTNCRTSSPSGEAAKRHKKNALRNRTTAIQIMADVDYAFRSNMITERQRSIMTYTLVDYMLYQTARINWSSLGLGERIRYFFLLWRPGKNRPGIRALFRETIG